MTIKDLYNLLDESLLRSKIIIADTSSNILFNGEASSFEFYKFVNAENGLIKTIGKGTNSIYIIIE